MTLNIEAIFDDVSEEVFDAATDNLSEKSWPVVASEQSNTGRPIDDIINNPRFMVSAIHGTPCTPRSSEQRARDGIRRDSVVSSMERNMARQRLRIAINQSRGEEEFYYGSAANDNTPMQKAAA
jgi:hypothetical protein